MENVTNLYKSINAAEDKQDALNIAVIGAGVSGLSFTNNIKRICKEKNKELKIKIFEAQKEFGGRVRPLKGFANFYMELGAEEVHGYNSDLYKIVEKHGGCPFNYWKEKIMYCEYKGELGTIEDMSKIYPEVRVANKVYEDIMDGDSTQIFPDLSIYDYFKKVQKEELSNENEHSNPESSKADHIIEGLFGVECGTDSKRLCPTVFNNMERSWVSGDSNLILMKRSYIEVLGDEFIEEIKDIQYNTEIKDIIVENLSSLTSKINNLQLENNSVNNNTVTIVDSNNTKYGPFDYVTLTVPVPILKKLNFSPPLKENKIKALNTLDHDDTAKLIMKFKNKFWPDDLAIKYIESKIPTWWPSGKDGENGEFLLTGMTSGENCRYLDGIYKEDKEKFINIALKDLARVYKLDNIKDLMIDYVWYNWKNEPYALGGYTFHVLNEGDSRKVIAESHCDKVLFCGDAIAPHGHISTVHGAYETGKHLAESIKLS